MSTRCLIGITDDVNSNKMRAVYCGHDGYPSWVGKILLDHYNTKESIEELLKDGDMSSIGETVDRCNYYYEDTFAEVCTIHKPEYWTDIEYRYAFDTSTNTWWVCNILDELVKVEDREEIKKDEKKSILS